MVVLLHIFQGLFALMAVLTFFGFMGSRNLGLLLSSVAYGGGAFASFSMDIWWPLGAAFASTWILRSLGLDAESDDLEDSLKPSSKLKSISKRVGKKIEISSFSLDDDTGEKELENLFEYAEELDSIKPLLEEFSVSRVDLKEIYWALNASGAGQWVGGHFVPASSVCYPETLRYYLTQKATKKSGKDAHSDMEIAINLINYFEGKSSAHIKTHDPA